MFRIGFWCILFIVKSPIPRNSKAILLCPHLPLYLLFYRKEKSVIFFCVLQDTILSICTTPKLVLEFTNQFITVLLFYFSKKDSSSFIPFSESLGYMIVCLHKVLTTILDNERNRAATIVALKCCAALVQATPYHKMKEGLITQLVMSTRKFLVHKGEWIWVYIRYS